MEPEKRSSGASLMNLLSSFGFDSQGSGNATPKKGPDPTSPKAQGRSFLDFPGCECLIMLCCSYRREHDRKTVYNARKTKSAYI